MMHAAYFPHGRIDITVEEKGRQPSEVAPRFSFIFEGFSMT